MATYQEKLTEANTELTNPTADRLARTKARIIADREANRTLKKLLKDITSALDLDEDRMAKRIDSAVKSEYGAINGLVNLVASVANWPVEAGDGSMVSTNRAILEDKFNLDLIMLDDIRKYRGYHSFLTDDIEIMEPQEPDYDNYTDYCSIFLEELGVTSNRPTICEATWQKTELREAKRAQEDKVQRLQELETHKRLMAELDSKAGEA